VEGKRGWLRGLQFLDAILANFKLSLGVFVFLNYWLEMQLKVLKQPLHVRIEFQVNLFFLGFVDVETKAETVNYHNLGAFKYRFSKFHILIFGHCLDERNEIEDISKTNSFSLKREKLEGEEEVDLKNQVQNDKTELFVCDFFFDDGENVNLIKNLNGVEDLGVKSLNAEFLEIILFKVALYPNFGHPVSHCRRKLLLP